MKPKKNNRLTAAALLTGGIAASAMLFSACNIIQPSLYGPPPDGPDGFDPESNVNEDVYGPPDWFEPEENDDAAVGYETEDAAEEATSAADAEEPTTEFRPEDNTAVPLYGPPPTAAES